MSRGSGRCTYHAVEALAAAAALCCCVVWLSGPLLQQFTAISSKAAAQSERLCNSDHPSEALGEAVLGRHKLGVGVECPDSAPT